MEIEIWSDIACPWCYIGKRRFETAFAEFPHRDEVEVQWRSYQLDPSLPTRFDGTELEYLASRKGLTSEQVRRMFEHVRTQAAAEGLEYDFDRLVVANSFRAHQLIHHAATVGRGAEAKERLLAGHFEHGRDIGDLDYLVEVGSELGLDAGDVRAALDDDRFADAVRADIAEGLRLGLRGVPFFVVDRTYGVSGAQPPAVFADVLEQVWRESHPLQMVVVTAAEACGPDGCAL